MTNDEFKAREIASRYAQDWSENDNDLDRYEKAILEAMRWKDEQWKERAKTTFCATKNCLFKCGAGLCDERILFNKLIDK